MKKNLGQIINRIEENTIMNSIRSGLIKIMPIALIGSLVVLLQAFVSMLQAAFETEIFDIPLQMIELLYAVTFGMMALYIVIFISISYMEGKEEKNLYNYGAPIAAVAVFIILNGGLDNATVINSFGVKGSFSAIISAILASALYCWLCRKLRAKPLYSEGADTTFNHIISSLLPIGIVLLVFTFCNFIMREMFGVSSLQTLLGQISNAIFKNMGNTIVSGLLFVFLSSIMWLCGIHGNNVLADVQEKIFARGVNINMFDLLKGNDPTVLFSGTFFNVFVFVGGCGSLLCLLIALLLFSKHGNNRYLARVAALPTLFNINEMLMFGFPVVLNPYMIIPFIVTPIVFTLTSAFSMYIGLVPYTIHPVEWTTPVLLSGYFSTGSFAGSILQAVNLIVGVCIYAPFVKMHDNSQILQARQKLERLVSLLQKSEENNQNIELMEAKGSLGNLAKNMGFDLRNALKKNEINIYHQPQFNENIQCIGTEALLRWEHPLYGMVYPPLVIKLAEEEGILYDLEKYIFTTAAKQIKDLKSVQTKEMKFSINVTVKTLMEASFEQFLQNLIMEYELEKGKVCIEITEQMALKFDKSIEDRLQKIHEMGYLLAIDDFSMGNTSVKYLQSNQFDIVKLDGNLTKNLNNNGSNKEIIGSIIYLSQQLGFAVLAEYVETEGNRKLLEDIGCKQYQGHLYSKAISYEEFKEFLED